MYCLIGLHGEAMGRLVTIQIESYIDKQNITQK